MVTVGSLFDGIGGWLLAATRAGAVPKWSSEIDPFPASVSHAHFPEVVQLGDVTKIKGDEVEPVDIICAGSPCQDLSIAGRREGLAGERSGLFHEAIRIVREMRVKTNGAYPKFFVWENVTGAFSSNGRHDFQAVLEEIGQTDIPMPGSGRWARAGMVRGKECGIAWRTLDAQFWGVPQHRERIFLIAGFGDWGGRTEVLFKPESVPRDNPPVTESGETVAETAGRSADTASWGIGNGQGHAEIMEEKCGTLNTMHDQKAVICLNDQGGARMNTKETVSTLRGEARHPPIIVEVRQPKVKGRGGAGAMVTIDKSTTISTHNTKTLLVDGVYPQRAYGQYVDSEVASAVKACGGSVGGGPENIACVYENNRKDARYTEQQKVAPALTAYMGTGGGNVPLTFGLKVGQVNANGPHWKKEQAFSLTRGDHECMDGYIARRLTPVECERLQGLPDNWTAYGSDSKRYKAIGNGMAQPCADYVMGQVVKAIMEGEKE